MAREQMEFDVVIVGAGPAGLAAAIRLAERGQQQQKPLNICVLDKGLAVGSHILAGAVLEPRALNELIPDWRDKGAPVTQPVTHDEFLFLTKKKAYTLPTPPQMKNHGNYVISLGNLCRWLADYAENLGVNIFPSFAVTDILYEGNTVCGVITGDKGVDRFGNPTARYQPGMELFAKHTFFAEGCRGSLTKKLIEKFDLRKQASPQTYGIGLKEIWEIPAHLHRPGAVMHSVGWPLDHKTYGGGFVYHLENQQVALGVVVGLDYTNPYLNPYEELQRFKTHPTLYPLLENGRRIAYGARTLNEGGLQSIPQLTVPGGLLIGCAAGFLNVPKIKGIHTAMKSGMLAADSILPLLEKTEREECTAYTQQFKQSWVYDELHNARNIRPAMRLGLLPGLAYAALDTYVLRGYAPWTFANHADYLQLRKAAACKKMDYPKHDNKVTFDLLSSLYLANVRYEENQPYHLKLADRSLAISVNYNEYASPEQRYCPAGVYEIVQTTDNTPRLQINGGNCIHCKACDIKDPTQNITWTPSEGGSGPVYEAM